MDALTLWVPDLLHKLRLQEAAEALNELHLPALQILIAKSDKFPVMSSQSFSEQASYLFHQPAQQPIAATEALSLFTDTETKHDFWIKVDPVQMVADRDSLVLISAKHLAINEIESKALLETFNQHFAEDGLQLMWGDNQSWYLNIKQAVDIKTTELSLVDNQPVNNAYPQGNAAQYWRQLINETQMLFFNAEVNQARRDKGWPEINGIWPWGEGSLDFNAVKQREQATIWSCHPYLNGLADLTAAAIKPSISSFADFNNALHSIDTQDQKEVNAHLVLLDEVYANIDQLEMEQWLGLLQELEQAWFAPLLHALESNQINSLLIDLGCGYRCHLKPNHLKRFWRFKKPLSKVAI